jgi:hypothetical protein
MGIKISFTTEDFSSVKLATQGRRQGKIYVELKIINCGIAGFNSYDMKPLFQILKANFYVAK